VLIAAALSLVLVTPSAFSVAAAVLLALATVATSWEWRHDLGGPPMLVLTIGACALVLGLGGLLTLAVGMAGWADPLLAKDVLPQVVGVQIALGLLPLTVLTVALPLVAGAAGAGAAAILPGGKAVGALGILLVSIGLDLRLLGSQVGAGDVEWAEMLAAAAIGLALL